MGIHAGGGGRLAPGGGRCSYLFLGQNVVRGIHQLGGGGREKKGEGRSEVEAEEGDRLPPPRSLPTSRAWPSSRSKVTAQTHSSQADSRPQGKAEAPSASSSASIPTSGALDPGPARPRPFRRKKSGCSPCFRAARAAPARCRRGRANAAPCEVDQSGWRRLLLRHPRWPGLPLRSGCAAALPACLPSFVQAAGP